MSSDHKFLGRMWTVLDSGFTKEAAMQLMSDIRTAEATGYVLSDIETRYLMELMGRVGDLTDRSVA